MAHKKIIIAIDGHSGCGKSSTAKIVANRLGYIYIDTGAMYRATTLYFVQHKIDISDQQSVTEALKKIDISFQFENKTHKSSIILQGENVESQIRGLEVSEKVSEVSAISAVRKKMVALQRKMGEQKGVVMDGRDIGTVVFPEAELKIFMTADLKIRAQRRLQELNESGHSPSIEEIIDNLEKRDNIDSSRSDSPLKKADDAILLDTSHLKFEDQVEKIVNLALNRISKN